MSLEITNTNNFFKMKGILDRKQLDVFQDVFHNIFEEVNALTISIEGLESIDRHGVNALADLHKESILKNKKLSIVGLGCKELYNHFLTETAA